MSTAAATHALRPLWGGAPEPQRAKFARVFMHAPGLFRALRPGERKRAKLDVTYCAGDTTMRCVGVEPLDATDLRVLQGLVAYATYGMPIERVGVPELLRIGRAERRGLDLRGDAIAQRTLGVQFRLKPFVEALGYANPGAATLHQIRDSLARLHATVVTLTRPGYEGTFNIASGYRQSPKTGIISVALNPELTQFVLAQKGYLTVRMDEVRELKSSAARLLYARLLFINEGESRRVGFDKLCGYVYGDDAATDSASKALRRHRTSQVKAALQELRTIDWEVSAMSSPSIYEISRPRRADDTWKRAHQAVD